MSLWDYEPPELNWAATLAAIPPQLNLPAGARWYEHPRVSRYALHRIVDEPPQTPPPPPPPPPPTTPEPPPPRSTGSGRRKQRLLAYPRFRIDRQRDDDLPLPWHMALKVVRHRVAGEYAGAFPVTLGEFRRIEEYMEADSRGRLPLRIPPRCVGAWRKQRLEADAIAMIDSWGCPGFSPSTYGDMARKLFELDGAQAGRVLGRYQDEEDGYLGDSEDAGEAQGRTEKEDWQSSPFDEDDPRPGGDDDTPVARLKCDCLFCIRQRTRGDSFPEGNKDDMSNEEG
ncbi:hypothetical protein FN846DRAFT_514828 [Sphaerosporella brunnea]|uniref:Uncharacterized protein n=1 Tax=Sphaerosporella brunnea TaxID=1250544 RepID=A0A5J5EES9_9PEZI|nr:hypothetical protein FN846DRAFT_514828 [Sphaerosporella brunnea]